MTKYQPITPLKRLLFERGISVTHLSTRARLSYPNLHLIVHGRRIPSLKTALEIARALDVTVEELFGYLLEED